MKRGTPNHPKVKRLARRLGIRRYEAVGLLELLWHTTGNFSPQGDIGKLTDSDIAEELFWDGDVDELIAALHDGPWIDHDSRYRLVVHDWEEHSDGVVKKKLKRAELNFITPNNLQFAADTDQSLTSQRIPSSTIESDPPIPIPIPIPDPIPTPPVRPKADKRGKGKLSRDEMKRAKESFREFWASYPACPWKWPAVLGADEDPETVTTFKRWKSRRLWENEKVMPALEAWKKKWKRDGFIPNPYNWINEKSYNADLDTLKDTYETTGNSRRAKTTPHASDRDGFDPSDPFGDRFSQ